MRRLLLLLAACLTSALLVACGDEEPEPVDGDGYSFEAPAGWEDVTGDSEEIADLIGGAGGDAAPGGGKFDSAIVSDEESNDFRTNFNVGLQADLPPGYDSREFAEQNVAVFQNPEQSAALLPDGIEIDYANEDLQPVTLDGEPAFQAEYGLTTPEAEVSTLQIYAVHEGTAYVGTYTADPELFDPRSEDLRHILETWEWE